MARSVDQTSAPRLGARELLDTVLDEGSWVGWDSAPVQPAPEGQPVCR